MKKNLLALLLFFAAQQAWAQQTDSRTQTLFNGKRPSHLGVYLAPAAKFTPIDGKFGVLTGAYGGVLINKKLMLGAGGWSLVNNIDMPRLNTNDIKQYINLWYTGFVAEYIFNPDKVVHFSAGGLIGGGGVSRRDRFRFASDDDPERDYNYDASGFFVAEPFVNIEINLISNLRLNIGGSYRYVAGTNTLGITDSQLNNYAVHVGFKAGIF